MRRAVIAVSAVILFVSSASATNLVVNGGFELGLFSNGPNTGWTRSGTPGSHWQWSGVAPNISYDDTIYGTPHSGNYLAWFGDDNGYTTISEWLHTVPGQEYILSFWVMNIASIDGSPSANSARVLVGGNVVGSGSNLDSAGWTQIRMAFVANLPITQLEFDFQNGPGWWGLDDVSVDPTPEPQVWWMCLAGLGSIAMLRRRRSAAR